MQRHSTSLKKCSSSGKEISLRGRLLKRRAFIACMLITTVLSLLSVLVINVIHHPALALTMLVSAFLFEIMGLGLLARSILRERKQSMHLWALEESEKQEVLLLRGNTEDELNRMLDYHLKVGNIQEADAISHRLMAIVDNVGEETVQQTNLLAATPMQHSSHGATAVPNASADNKNGSLPDWLSSETEERKKAANLPDWLK